jgi:purine nucleosidase
VKRGPREFTQFRRGNVQIESGSDLTLGMTVANWWRVTGREPNAMFMGGLHRDGFYRLLTERLGRL